MSLYALGLGEMHVKSSLDQPFVAEIKLIDARTVKLASIKVSVADPDNYGRLGLRPTAALDLLRFKVEKNELNQAIIKIESTERMTEPYMDLVVDLLWPGGQLFKAYEVILDPVGYQLASSSVQNDVLSSEKITAIEQPINLNTNPASNDARKKPNYGPTLPNETIWALAQRYKRPGVTLPQVVLAILGANPAGFDNGNLNGLKVGVRLNIPTVTTIKKVPAQLAEKEIQAQDLAWNKKTPIQHVIVPPYINVASSDSTVPELPQFTQQAAQLNSEDFITPINNLKSSADRHNSSIETTISRNTAAINDLKQSNVLLKEQLQLLHEQNNALQQRIDKRDKDIQLVQQQMAMILKQRQDLASHENSSLSQSQSFNLWFWSFLLIFAAGSGTYWYFNRRVENDGVKASPELSPIPIQPQDTDNAYVDDEIEHYSEKQTEEENILEFESGLHQLIPNESIQNEDETNKDYLASLSLTDHLDTKEQNADNTQRAAWSEAEANELAYLLKNIQASDTLEEVQQHGTNSQKEEAASLLLSDTR